MLPARVQREAGGRINRRALRALNPGAGFPGAYTPASDAEAEWARSGGSRIGTGSPVHGHGLVRIISADGAISKLVEAAEAPVYEGRGWTLVLG